MTFWQFAFKNVSRNSKAYFAYFVSSAFSIMVFFSFTVYAYHPRLQSVQSFQERDPLMNLASTAQLVIVMFSFFFLLYSIGTFLNVRKQQFGILTILGISQRQLKRLLFTENMIIGILSIFIGIQGGLVFSNFFLLVTSKLTNAKGLYLYWPIEAIIVTTVTFIILFLIVSTFTPMFIRTRKTTKLIKGVNKEKSEKKTIYTDFTICFNLFRTMLLYCWLSARLHNGKKCTKWICILYHIIYFATRSSRNIFILFPNISSLYLHFKKTKKVLYEANKYVMDFRFN